MASGSLVRCWVLLLLMFGAVTTAWAVEAGDDGLHKQPWFAITFKDIAEDINESTADGKRLLLVFEQRGCSACFKMHQTLFADPEIEAYLKNHFTVVQFNLIGDEEVTDLDGGVFTEKSVADRWQIYGTPTLLFLPDSAAHSGRASDVAVARLTGLMEREKFLDLLHWVQSKGYAINQTFESYHAEAVKSRGG